MSIEVLIVDDHSIIRDLFRRLLQRENDIRVVGEAENGRQAIRLVRQLLPDVIVMDVNMPTIGGIDATRRIRREFPDVEIVGFSTETDREIVSAMLKAGASGFIVKSHAPDHLAESIRAVLAGRTYLSLDLCFKQEEPGTEHVSFRTFRDAI